MNEVEKRYNPVSVRERYTQGHLIEDFMDDDLDVIMSTPGAFSLEGVCGRVTDYLNPPKYTPELVCDLMKYRTQKDWVNADITRATLEAKYVIRIEKTGAVTWQVDYRNNK